MLNGRDVIYTYDGSFEGLMSVVFECYLTHTRPYDICCGENVQEVLMCCQKDVETNPERADRVIRSIYSKISSAAFYHIYCAYLSEAEGRELAVLDFLDAGYKYGASVVNRLNLDGVYTLMNIAKTVASEAHLYLGFVRFKKLSGGIYYSEIEPKAHVLPIISNHFCERFSSMPFMIHDIKHGECLVYNGKSVEIRRVESEPILKYDEDEKLFQSMWRDFYNTIAIKERRNEKCRNSLLPKRYRRCMTEFAV
ncbi:MAG TPA: TIGR03915 family putative DNA repair protein [Candidatus Ornithomonoglobus intestinigallinarum]|uniref:TIGR03915 family putative DNA repair protein n=1 Tax=Candidatus Ornithomonoglobus intestinigallinarum TaxID=2840894 RepID=A0A9D1H1D7_9FIRM|nr:TIGR03915 family putative DNA repair protein [Candidatus Ornithomonoglobus intestinigallinarum]